MDSAVIFEDRENLNDFLEEAELQQYYELFRDILKVSKVSQLKFVLTEDLVQIGLSRPEQRRYKKIYTKYFPNPYISKIRKMLKSNKKRDQNAQAVSMPSEILPVFDNNVKIPTKHIISIEDITINKELGMGQFGVVQQGTWTTGNQRLQVAIKCLGHEQMTSNSTEFLKEAAVMHSIEHPNIVRLYGVVLHLDSLMLVTELAPLRSLLECLREVSLRLNFPVPNLCEFAEQICDGMTYLESKRLIHRDLAARNILVFNKDRVKISDFGLSRALGVGKDYYQTNYNVNLKLPVAWCAPECILFLRFTSASDVWAFGVCLWEMFTYGFQPWAAFSGQQILEAIDAPNFQRLERPECCPEAYYATMLECWAHDFNNRPKFKDLGPKLRSIRPEQVQALTDCQKPEEGRRNNYLDYKSGQIITVLGKQSMTKSSMWYGVLPGCACGMFDPSQMKPYIPPEKNVCHVSGTISPHPIRHSARSIRSSLLRSDVKRHTYTGKRTIQRSMISSPQGDVKHTGHVGLDGAYFGDISFLDPAGCPPRQVVTPYKPSEDLEQVPLINPNSPSHLTGATGTTPYPMLTSNRPDSKANCDEVDLSCENKTKSLKKVNNKMTSESSSGKSILNKVRCATLSRSHKVDNGAAPKTDEVHEYHEITDNNMDAAALYNKSDTRLAPKPENLDVGKSTTDFSQSLLDEMESMFRNLDCKRRDEASTSSKHAESATSVPPISRFFNLPDPQDMGVRTYVRPQPRMYRRPAYLPGPRPSRSHRRSGEARESSRSDECSKTRWRVKHEGTQTSHRNRPRSEEPRIRSHRRPASGERPTTHRTRSSTEEPGITRSKRSGSAETSNTKRITHRNRSSSEEAGIRTHVHFADVHETNTKRITHRNRSSSEEAGNTKRISHRNRSSSEEAGISHRIEPEYEVPRSHTLTKAERKKGFATSTMKPMSAHDEKTLNTAVALANEITSKSMNDLGGDKKYPQSPSDRSKFHFKFPLSLHHTSHGHEPEKEKESAGRVERRNFSEEARSVPDLQSTITAESKLVYTSLVEEPTPSTSLGNTRGTHMGKESTGILKPPAIPNPATIPKPVRVTTQVQFHSLQNHSSLQARPYARGHTEDFDYYAENVLPLPPRTTKPKLVDKPRHIRKYPLKIMEPKAPLASADGSPIIIYQNTKRPVHEQEPKKVEVDGNKVEDEEVVVIDEVDASSKLDINTNPFTNVAGPSHINPFSTFYDEDTEDDWTLQLYMNSETDSDESLTVLVKDCKDHVSVEDLLEFADLKPCGRQRGVESDEVRIMCKVLKSQATPEQCLEALELSDWDVHNAIKLVRVKVTVGSTVSFEECHHQLKKSNGDIVKAINILAT